MQGWGCSSVGHLLSMQEALGLSSMDRVWGMNRSRKIRSSRPGWVTQGPDSNNNNNNH